MRPLQHELEPRCQGDTVAIGRAHRHFKRQAFGDRHPEIGQRFARLFPAALEQTVRKGDCVHGASAGAADTVIIKATVFQQIVENAPGESTMGTATLQGEVDERRIVFTEIHRDGDQKTTAKVAILL